MTPQEIQAALEAIIYAADEPATLDQIANALGVEKMEARTALDLLVASYSVDERGIEVRKVAGGWKFYTKPQHHEAVRKFIKSLQPPLRLTMPALETLAVIAYKQPATVPEINEIRGVNVGGVIKTLLEKRLITTAGRKEVIGRPILYRTSKQFMIRFGLSDLDELPSLKEFEQLAQAALGSDEGIAPPEPEDANESTVPGAMFEPLAVAADENDLGELAEDVNEAPLEVPAAESHSAQSSGEHAVDTGEISERSESVSADSIAQHELDSAEGSKAASAAAGNSEPS